MSTRNMVAELPVVLDFLSDGLKKNAIFGEEGNNLFWLLQHQHFVRETSNQHPYISHDAAQTEARRNPESYK